MQKNTIFLILLNFFNVLLRVVIGLHGHRIFTISSFHRICQIENLVFFAIVHRRGVYEFVSPSVYIKLFRDVILGNKFKEVNEKVSYNSKRFTFILCSDRNAGERCLMYSVTCLLFFFICCSH